MLAIAGLTRRFGTVTVIPDLTLRVAPGQRLVILGPNGAGKTTLLRLIAGEIPADAGRITMAGRDITPLSADARARAGLGRSFQTTALFESFTIAQNLTMAARARQSRAGPGRDPLRDPRLAAEAAALADMFDLHPVSRPIAALDHGTRRKLDLAMALAGGPRLVLLDEPASGFGPGGAAHIHDLIAALPRNLTLIVIEHDLELAFALADRIVILDAGRIVFDGAPAGARPVLRAIYDA